MFTHVGICRGTISAFQRRDESRFITSRLRNLQDSGRSRGRSCRRVRCSRSARRCPGRGRRWFGCSRRRNPATAWKTPQVRETRREDYVFVPLRHRDTLQLPSGTVMENKLFRTSSGGFCDCLPLLPRLWEF